MPVGCWIHRLRHTQGHDTRAAAASVYTVVEVVVHTSFINAVYGNTVITSTVSQAITQLLTRML
jgi:hypothetical protein